MTLTHALEGTAAYEQLRTFVLDHIGEAELSDIRRELGRSELYSEEDLEHEVIANACSEVLMDSQAIQAMAKENRTLFERVRQFVGDLVQRIRSVYRQENSFRREAILMRDVADQLAELWDAAVIERVGGTEADDGAEFSYREDAVQKDEINNGIHTVAQMKAVTRVSTYTGSMKASEVVKAVGDFFDSVGGTVENHQLGDITLSRRGVKDDLAHGTGRSKVASFMAIPEILRNGQVVDYQVNWKNRRYDTAIVAAPIQIESSEYMAGVILRRNGSQNNYVHEVVAIEQEGATPFDQGRPASQQEGDPGGDTPSVNSILQRMLDAKGALSGPEFSARVYEQTDSDILEGLDTALLTTQAEREAYFRWERQRNQYQAWQAKVDELQAEYDAIEDKSSHEAKNLAARMQGFRSIFDLLKDFTRNYGLD